MRKNNSCNSALFKVLPIRSVDQSIEKKYGAKSVATTKKPQPVCRYGSSDLLQNNAREWETREDF